MFFKGTLTNLSIIFITVFLLFPLAYKSYTQNIPLGNKKEFLSINKRKLEDTINKQTALDYPFIVGRYHSPVTNKIHHPYFKVNEWVNGSLVFGNKSYNVDGLKYDIESDHLVFLMYTRDYMMNTIALEEQMIPEFTLLNSTFRYYYSLLGKPGNELMDGYYEVVYDGELKFLVRWEKSESLKTNSVYLNYDTVTRMFLLKNDRMISVKSMRKLIGQLKDKKKVVRRFVRDNHFKLNQSNYFSATEILGFYESMK